MGILENLEKFLLTTLAIKLSRKSLDPDEDLLELGVIDSLGLMKLVVFMEDTFGIKVNDEEIVPENFNCLNSMAKFVEKQLQNK
jgi:acyl carrier protein